MTYMITTEMVSTRCWNSFTHQVQQINCNLHILEWCSSPFTQRICGEFTYIFNNQLFIHTCQVVKQYFQLLSEKKKTQQQDSVRIYSFPPSSLISLVTQKPQTTQA